MDGACVTASFARQRTSSDERASVAYRKKGKLWRLVLSSVFLARGIRAEAHHSVAAPRILGMRALSFLFGPGAFGFGGDRHRQVSRDKRPSNLRRNTPTPQSSTSLCLGGRSPSPYFAPKPCFRRNTRVNQTHHKSVTATSSKMNAIVLNAPLMAQSLGGAFVLDMAIQFVGWAGSATMQTEKFYDLFGSLAFMSCAVTSFMSSPQAPRQGLITGMVCAWTARLGAFLVTRVFRDGGDSRFDAVKKIPGQFAVYWFMQGLWVWITALPCFLVNGLATQSALHAGDYVCLAVWLFGVVFETTADFQKYKFKKDPANKGKFIDVGLWSVSRHPNYFGEIAVWLGVCGVAMSSASVGVSLASVASPLFVTFLLTKVSGIPILEKSADERWGDEAKYAEYKKNTPCLVPRLPGMRKEL